MPFSKRRWRPGKTRSATSSTARNANQTMPGSARETSLLDEPPLEVCGQPRERERDHEEQHREGQEDLERVNLAGADRRHSRDALVLALGSRQQLEAANHSCERRVLDDVHEKADERRQQAAEC